METGPAPPANSPMALVLGSGITALGVLRCLGRSGMGGMVVGDAQPFLRRSRWYHPAPDFPGGALADYLDSLPLESAVLIPCSDEWVEWVGALGEATLNRFPCAIAPPSVMERFLDKGRFAATLTEMDVAHPRTAVVGPGFGPEVVEDFERAFIKPRDSLRFQRRFGVKGWWPDGPDDLAEKLHTLAEEGIPAVVQEYIPGPSSNHYFLDGFLDAGGVVKAAFLRRRLRMSPADFGNSTYMMSVRRSEGDGGVDAVLSMLRKLGYRGIFSCEMKRDERDGVLKILEVNARPWWYVGFAAFCGVNVVEMAYLDALGLQIPEVESYLEGRRLIHPYFDIHACRDERGSLFRAGLTWTRSLVGADQPVFQWDDPMPGVTEAVRLVGGFLSRRIGSLRRGD